MDKKQAIEKLTNIFEDSAQTKTEKGNYMTFCYGSLIAIREKGNGLKSCNWRFVGLGQFKDTSFDLIVDSQGFPEGKDARNLEVVSKALAEKTYTEYESENKLEELFEDFRYS